MKPLKLKTLKALIPTNFLNYIKEFLRTIELKKSYVYDFKRYKNHSRLSEAVTPLKLAGEIISLYHVIEKGLTMPEVRPGFGQERIPKLCTLCSEFISKFGLTDEQVKHAIAVIYEYEIFHKNRRYELTTLVADSISKLKSRALDIIPSSQTEFSKQEYFVNVNDNFSSFSQSRKSIRNFTSEEVPVEMITTALELARNTPSACNRQPWRTYVHINKHKIERILEIQAGARGFGHKANKLIIITGEVGGFCGSAERNQVYIDSGIYAMNVLYSLHFNKIAACILNCCHTQEKDTNLRHLCSIKESEVFICMIACGMPNDNFKIAISERYSLKNTNTVII